MDVDWKDAAKELGKALAKGAASAAVRGIVILFVFVVLNFVFSVMFFFMAGLTGGGHGSFILFPLALVPFIPFVVIAFIVAQKQGISRIVAGALESQGPTLSAVGAHYLGRFLTGRYGNLRETRAAAAFDHNWQRFIRGSTESSWAVRLVLRQVTDRVPMGNMIAELAEQGTPAAEVPKVIMGQIFTGAAESRLRPSWMPILLLLGVNIAWFPLAIYLTKNFLMK